MNVVLSMGHQERRYLVSHTSVMSLAHQSEGASVVTLTRQSQGASVVTLTHRSEEVVCISQVKKLEKRLQQKRQNCGSAKMKGQEPPSGDK